MTRQVQRGNERRLRLKVAYAGGAHAGWQSQVNGDGVQDHLERACEMICGDRVRVHGAGRTDAGVHAFGQVAHLDWPGRGGEVGWLLDALNGNLPATIRVWEVREVSADFHARYDAVGKCYGYRIWLGRWQHPLELGRSWHFPYPVEAERLPGLLDALVGQHDFGGFTANNGKRKETTVRTLYAATMRCRGDLVEMRFTGSGFLYRMARMLVGGVMDCARVGKDAGRLVRQLAEPDRLILREAAPAHGLYLERVYYRRLKGWGEVGA